MSAPVEENETSDIQAPANSEEEPEASTDWSESEDDDDESGGNEEYDEDDNESTGVDLNGSTINMTIVPNKFTVRLQLELGLDQVLQATAMLMAVILPSYLMVKMMQ